MSRYRRQAGARDLAALGTPARGSLPSSGKWRGVLAESEDQPHLIDGLHAVSGWRENWTHLATYFQFPAEVRKMIDPTTEKPD